MTDTTVAAGFAPAAVIALFDALTEWLAANPLPLSDADISAIESAYDEDQETPLLMANELWVDVSESAERCIHILANHQDVAVMRLRLIAAEGAGDATA